MLAGMSLPAKRLATVDDLLAIPEDERYHEIIGGELVEKAQATGPHSFTQGQVAGQLGPFSRRFGGGPGGWWILVEAQIDLGPRDLYRPDVAGWRRERLPVIPRRGLVKLPPDWVCEVLSRNNARVDLVKKMRVYQRAGVGHYWIVDPDEEMLFVYRHTPDGYLLALSATRGDEVRAEPFGEVEIEVAELFADAE